MESTRRDICPVFLCCCCLLVIKVSSLDHSATLKSFNGLRNECALYQTSEEDCSKRCLALVGQAWNDYVGRPNVSFSRFFQPDPWDYDNTERTGQCLEECVDSLPLTSTCQRASNSLCCYLDQFGNLVKQRPLYVPKTPLHINQLIMDCALMLQIPKEKVLHIARYGYSSTREGPCLARCMLIRAGLYSDDYGPRIDRFFIQCDGYEAEFKQFVVRCFRKLKSQHLDRCTLAVQVYDECIASNEYGNGLLVLGLEQLFGVPVVGEFIVSLLSGVDTSILPFEEIMEF